MREFEPLATSPLDAITGDEIAVFIVKRRQAGLAIVRINRQLEVLQRMLKLAFAWGKVEKLLPKVEMLSGENHRERVLSADEEHRYLGAASAQSTSLHIEKSNLKKQHRKALAASKVEPFTF